MRAPHCAVSCGAPRPSRLKLPLQEGSAIELHGKIGVYEVGGQYQFYVDQIRPVGEGVLFQEFLRLKAMLEVRRPL